MKKKHSVDMTALAAVKENHENEENDFLKLKEK